MRLEVFLLPAFVTPTPTGATVDPDLVTPGPWGFAIMAIVGLAVIALVWDMQRRIRRGRYREEVREELDAEEKAAAQGAAASRASDVDDQDIDPDADNTR
ncbi:hypothetical protein LQ938_10370 [Microbacterium sp. cx-55]|uniref:hypothetical protein n=1 Tax=unclassified Microbacterium TaxID=2609290 RepID=UPI001CBBDADE|nr:MULTISPECIES: hypothetical protein [unclassified Microbacterium]MBZ4485834.1 hypothetical protein [Microbacterium sp. cx-55]MCC4906797.1 hypothetical protein [Microbacterium sp. cx-59]UGB34287.1 hypothetical protein LQ938_10370 [Microbacterium sp. cx-55]